MTAVKIGILGTGMLGNASSANSSGKPMLLSTLVKSKLKIALMLVTIGIFAGANELALLAQSSTAVPEAKQDMPDWLRRGIPGEGHAALKPLIGTWRVHKSIYGTLGRSPDLPPIVSDDIITRREWVANGHYIEDLTEGKIEGNPYWRKGWLGYSNMDHRYEWTTIDSLNTTMMRYLAKPESGVNLPIGMTGVFTDQGVVNEKTVGKPVGQRTVIRIEGDDRHIFELYFTPPGEKEQLADRSVYMRIKE